MPDPVSAIGAVSEAVREITTLFREWIAGADIRRMRRAIEYAERYIRLSSPLISEHFPDTADKTRRELRELEHDFFKFN